MESIFDYKFADVEVFGRRDTIYNHLMNARRTIDGRVPTDDMDFDFFAIRGKNIPSIYFPSFEKMLWCKFFKVHPELNPEMIPSFLKPTINFMKTDEGKEFTAILKSEGLIILEKDIFTQNADIICHQVNCQGVMGRGIAKHIKENFPECFDEYKEFCDSVPDKQQLLGQCLIVDVGDKFIANLFGQLTYGSNGCYTDYNAFEEALTKVKFEAMQDNLSVAIPFGIGSSLAGGDWNTISNIIKRVFADYPVIICKI